VHVNRVEKWLELWRIQPVELKSPLSVQAAEQRLAAELTRARARFRTRPTDPDGRFVVGRMRRGPRIRAYGARIGWENSFVPLLDAHLVPEDDGCRLSGTLGWTRWVRVQSAGGIAVAALWTLGSAVGLAMRAHGPFLPFLAFGTATTALGVFLPGWAGSAGWRDAGFLLDWLHERLQVR
jgi:hypothetical protein